MSMVSAAALIVVAVVVMTIAMSARRRRREGFPARLPSALRLIALAVALAVAGLLVPAAWREGGLMVLVVPVFGAFAAVTADLLGRGQAVITTLSAVVMLFWSLLTGLGPGLYFIIPSLFMVAAATATWYQLRPVRASVGDPA